MAPRKRSAVVRKSSPEVMIELDVRHDKACMFCNRKEINEMTYGLMYQLDDVVVHYFCILLSSRADQNGSDKEGIWGFLLKDIKAELVRGSREKCYYCGKFGATISCSSPKCQKKFHLPCGLKNGSMHQFFQTFKSFCQQHRVTQTVDLQELQNSNPVECIICKEDVVPTPLPTSLWAPCCKRNAWFHRDCIQTLALSSGYFFKCPLCCNVEKFKSRMLTLGIYIPSRDASWETVPNAYAELLERHGMCNSDLCLCPHPEKRKFQTEAGSWEMILCYACGSSGTHRLCSSLKCTDVWYCSSCNKIANADDNTVDAKRRKVEETTTVDKASNSGTANSVVTNGATTNGVTNNGMGHSNVTSNNVANNDTTNNVVNDTLTLPEAIPSTSHNLRPRRPRPSLATSRNSTSNTNRGVGRPRRVLRRREAPLSVDTPINANRSSPQQLSSDIIIISDSENESDADSDVQVLTYIDQPIEAIDPNLQPNFHNPPGGSRRVVMPVVSSYTSMSTDESVVVNNSINIFNPRIQSIYTYSPRSMVTVDLISSDEE